MDFSGHWEPFQRKSDSMCTNVVIELNKYEFCLHLTKLWAVATQMSVDNVVMSKGQIYVTS